MKTYYVYILSSRYRALYTGVTNNLQRRTYEHRSKVQDGFTKQYNITRLVYFESFSEVRAAIDREKQIKKWSRRKKLVLIGSMNPEWRDLATDWLHTEHRTQA